MSPSAKKFIRSLVWRRTQDNKTRLGAVPVLIAGLLIVGGIYAVTRPRSQYTSVGPAKAPTGVGAFAKVDTERAVSSGASYTHADPLQARPDPLTQSTRLESQPRGAASTPIQTQKQDVPDFLDTVRQATVAQQEVPKGGKHARATNNGLPEGFIDEGDAGVQVTHRTAGTGAQMAGPPISVGQPVQVQTGNVELSGLTVYKREKTSTAVAQKTGFDIGNFLPLGAKIPVAFVEDVTTMDLSGLVELGVVENVEFGGDIIRLPYGTRIYCTASTKNVGDRIAINVHTIVFPETGQEVPITGVVLDEDGQPGVRGYYVPQPTLVQAFPYANTAASALLESLKTKSNVVAQSSLGVTSSSSVDENSLGNIALSSAQKGVEDAMTRKQAELDRRYPAYVLVKKGTQALIQLTSALDLEARGFNAKNPTPGQGTTNPAPVNLNALKAVLPFEGTTSALRPQSPQTPPS